MGYTKISLKGLSSSRVYGVYPSNVVNEPNRTFIRTTVTEPVFLVKISHSPDRSCREHRALKQLARNFGSSPWAQLFYVHQSFVFENWVVLDTAPFSSVAVAGHFATKRSLFSLGITNDAELARLCLDRPGAIQETCWWNPLLNSALPNDTSPVATLVMKHAHRLAFVNDTAFQSVMVRLGEWLERIHTAGVLHTDLRPSNIMWLPVKSGTVATEIENKLTLSVDEVLGSAVSSEGEARVNRTLESQFDMVLRIEDPPSVAGSCSQDGVVGVPSEISEGATATGGPEATATTEAEEITDNANDAVGVTSATATDDSVTQQELMLPIVIDFDCAELLSEGTNSCEVGISVPGARSNLIRKQKELSKERLSVEWETYDDIAMMMESAYTLMAYLQATGWQRTHYSLKSRSLNGNRRFSVTELSCVVFGSFVVDDKLSNNVAKLLRFFHRRSCSRAYDHNLNFNNLDAMENSSTVPTCQDAGSCSQLIAFLTERLDKLERKFEASTEAILEKLNELEGNFNNMFAQRVETTTPVRYACISSNSTTHLKTMPSVSVISQKGHDKEAALQGAIKDLLKAGNAKYKTKVLIWTASETSFEIVSADDIPNPVLSTTTADCSVTTALRCCGIDDAEAAARAESSENPFTVFARNSHGKDTMQSNLQDKWNRSGSCPLLAACDGRTSGKLPMFLPGGAPNSFDLTGRPDIIVNCFIKRSFGFAVNGGTSSFLVSIHRNLVRDQPHWYEDTVHILKIATTHVAGIWNELTKKAQQDLCFVLDRDVFALAATLR
eukprot:gene3577-4448_t